MASVLKISAGENESTVMALADPLQGNSLLFLGTVLTGELMRLEGLQAGLQQALMPCFVKTSFWRQGALPLRASHLRW